MHKRIPRNAQVQQVVHPGMTYPSRSRFSIRRILAISGLLIAVTLGVLVFSVAFTLNQIFVGGLLPMPEETVQVKPEPGQPNVGSQKPAGGNGPTVTPQPAAQTNGRITIVLLGVDQRKGETMQGTRSDTIMLLTIDTVNKTAGLLSIPRDLLVTIPGYVPNKINVANALGGPPLVKKTIEQNFGVKVNYYALINFRGFTRLIDALGGVDINVPKAIYDDEYPLGDTNAVTTIRFSPGMQHMDGERALIYVRTRHQDNDFGRIQRQQQVLLAIRSKAMQGGTLLRWPEILNSLGDTLQTDMPLGTVPGLLNLSRELHSDAIRTRTIDQNMVTSVSSPTLGEYLDPNWPAIKPVVREMFSAPVAGR